MSKINILNLVLFIAVVTLGIVIYNSEEKSYLLDLLSTIKADDVKTIHIHHNQNKISLIKNNEDQWRIDQPVSIAANIFRISSLLKLLNAPVHSQYSIDEINLTSLGFNRNNTSISFDDNTIIFGATNPATHLRYVKMNDTIYTIEDAYYPLISSNVGTLVALNLLPMNSRIEKLILKNQTISKNDDGLWQSNIDISPDNINKTIDHWQNDQAFAVHEYLTRESLGEVFIYLNDTKTPIVFTIANLASSLILARPDLGLEYHLDVMAFNTLIAPTN